MSNQNMGREDAPPALDDVLILNAIKGDETSLVAIYDFYSRRIFRYFYSRVENSEDAEDLAAQTFMSIIEALPRYQHRGQFTAWVFQVAHSKAIDFFRRTHSRIRKEADADGVISDQALESIIQHQTVETLKFHVQSLGDDERELLRLRFVGDLTYIEIAQSLGRKEDAVRKSLNRILNKLYERMEADHA